ncbi:hypothetical protein C8J57DRAFT_1236904 [Mycena rebaudengoi]|nr:hypothetical protein C8J57DRAFT_1236904 [Mycena rebaudengoi]
MVNFATSGAVLVCEFCGAASVLPGGDCTSVGASRARRERGRAQFSAGLVPMWVESTRRTKRAPCRHPHAQRIARPHTTLRVRVESAGRTRTSRYGGHAGSERSHDITNVLRRLRAAEESACSRLRQQCRRSDARRLLVFLQHYPQHVARRWQQQARGVFLQQIEDVYHAYPKRCPHYGVPGAANSARRYS